MATTEAIRDDVYCHLTARRAVARAALHLGVESMTAEAVDVVASCLLEYLQRLGSTTAATAEAAGRSSAHCHVYDILAATELCATVATGIHHHHHDHPATSSTTTTTSVGGAGDLDGSNEWGRRAASWKDLASFCFGPEWNSATATSSSMHSHSSSNQFGDGTSNNNRGKVGPSAADLFLERAAATAMDTTNETGWNAPFPDELPPFPVCSQPQSVANPHTFAEDALALHHFETDVVDANIANGHADFNETATNIPDAAFYITDWNPTLENRALESTEVFGEKRKLDTDAPTSTEGDEPPTKKAKITEGTSLLTDPTHARRPRLPSYVPTFYPPFPTHQDTRMVVVDEDAAGSSSAMAATRSSSSSTNTAVSTETRAVAPSTTTTASTRHVRSALVGASRQSTSTVSHWGSSWSSTTFALAVAPGRPLATETSSSSIVPLNRASGSRVSRILEGSLEPAVL